MVITIEIKGYDGQTRSELLKEAASRIQAMSNSFLNAPSNHIEIEAGELFIETKKK